MDTERSDEELAKLAQSGDVESGSLLFERHQLKLMDYSLYVCRKNKELAEDVLQQAYLTIWNRFSEFGAPYEFAPWVKRFIDNIARNAMRAEKNKTKIFGTGDNPDDINNMADKNNESLRHKFDAEDINELLPILERQLL
ncbi:MAG: RNA polymerase sigma factor [Limisphaerales bacterium]